MLCSANPLVDTVMNSQAHCQGKLLHYTTAQWSLISLGGQHPGGSPDQRIYSGLEVPISLVIQSVQSPSLSLSLSLCLPLSPIQFILLNTDDLSLCVYFLCVNQFHIIPLLWHYILPNIDLFLPVLVFL